MATKKEWIKVLSAILESTGCREICKKCGGRCCIGCKYYSNKGCKSIKRSLGCTAYTCPKLDERLKEFSLSEYFNKLRQKSWYYHDMRHPCLHSNNYEIKER